MKFSTYILFLIALIVSVISCSDDACNEDTDTLLTAKFVVKDEALETLNFVDDLSLYSPEWTDSIHFTEEGSASDNTLSFMLSPNSDTSEIIITSKNAPLNDTMTFIAERELIFFSEECGFITKFMIDTVFHSYSYIDSIEITNKEISTNKNGQIKIYF